jgi:restriction system protein
LRVYAQNSKLSLGFIISTDQVRTRFQSFILFLQYNTKSFSTYKIIDNSSAYDFKIHYFWINFLTGITGGLFFMRVEISNHYLGKSKAITAQTEEELKRKIKYQRDRWKKESNILHMKEKSKHDTKKALEEIEEYRSILKNALDDNHKLNWNRLYDKSSFDKDEPQLELYYASVGVPKEMPLLEMFLPPFESKRKKKEKEAEILFEKEYADYQKIKNAFISKQQEKNFEIDLFKKNYELGKINATEKYFKKVLIQSRYPKTFNQFLELEYIPERKTLIVELQLPHPDELPNTVECKFVQTRKEVDTITMKKKDFQQYYDDVQYQITLRSIYECFSADYATTLEAVAFNGWIHGVDTATGTDFDSCVISVLVDKSTFLSLNLHRVVPKECFRKLKGLTAGPMYHMAPVKPVLELNKKDKRFVESKEVLAEINSVPNLAEMSWEDFEHLVRELFELYFKEIGGEVRVTQASREGGIDAVVFDPDPIRGGKYIIQAKCYNNVVPVAHVRELNGIMSDEGAIKGILVTTSHFGKDSWDFVKDKPLTLIDGPRLVHMLNEHGHKVRIEIKK